MRLRLARQVWVFSPSSGAAWPRVAASTRSVSVSGVLAATRVLLPRTATHTLSSGSNRILHRGNLARRARVSSAARASSAGMASPLPAESQSVPPAYGRGAHPVRESPDRAGRRGELDCVSAASLEQAQVVLVAPNGELAQAECAGL